MTGQSEFKTAVSFWVFLTVLCGPMLVMAQSEKEDVVYLKDGSILRGEIIERAGNETVKIQTVGRNVLVISLEEIKKVKREEVPRSTHYKKSGYFNHTGMDILLGQDDTTVRFQMVNGYRFMPKLSVGLGISFVPYNDPLGLIPIFLDWRYKFREANMSPFIFFRSGYSLSLLSDENMQVENHRGGIILNPGVGIEFYTHRGFGWYFTAGLNMDNSSFEQERRDGRIVETDIDYRRIVFGIGLVF